MGDGAVGKTSMLISYTTNTFPEDYIPTVFDNYSTTILLPNPYPSTSESSQDDHQLFKLNLWDTAGQEEYDRLRPLSYPQTDIFLACFSICEPSSLRNIVDKWYPEIIQNSATESSEFYRKLGKYPIFLVGTKSDLRDDATEKERLREANMDFVSQEEIDEVVNQCGFMGYGECSAATQLGVREVFEKSVSNVVFEPERLSREKRAAQHQQKQNEIIKEQQRQNNNLKEDLNGRKQQSASKRQSTNSNNDDMNDKMKNGNSRYLKKIKKKSKCVIL